MNEIIIGLHCHQPVGNFPFVFREAFEKSYRPILEALEKAPAVRVSLHYSGPLLEWLEAEEMGYCERVKALVAKNQVELWGSGFYEPILPSIPRADRIDQVKMMADRIQARFGKRPRGLWLTERVWEPTLASDLAEAGVEYLALDDHHFRLAGLDPERLSGYFLTEDEGRTVAVFPILKELRYRIPFADPEKTIEYVNERARTGVSGPACFYDDGEKLGVWPRTYETAWEKGWVRRFFDLLSDPASGVTTVLPGVVRDRDRPQGRIYLPTGSYPEMMEWAFPADTGQRFEDLLEKVEHDLEHMGDVKPFLAGGFWRNFLVKYPEINFLQKRVVRASKLLREKLSGNARKDALQELFRAECNCAYWHGVFGGAYLPHLRRALWEHLIKAERALVANGVTFEENDLECDGSPDVRVDHARYAAYVKPGLGGAVLGFDLKDKAYPLFDVIARRREAYHAKMLPASEMPEGSAAGGIHGRYKLLPEGVEIVSDWHRRASVVDHLYPECPTAEALAHARVRDQGDLAIEPWKHRVLATDANVTIELEREGGVFVDGSRRPILVKRSLVFSKARPSFAATWSVTNRSRDAIRSWYATDWNLALVPVEGNTTLFVRPPEGNEFVHPDPRKPMKWSGPLPPQRVISFDARPFIECGFREPWLGVSVRLVSGSRDAKVVAYPVTTISQSESGVDLVHQGTCLTVVRELALEPGATATFATELVVEAL
jgi:alpha-amylase